MDGFFLRHARSSLSIFDQVISELSQMEGQVVEQERLIQSIKGVRSLLKVQLGTKAIQNFPSELLKDFASFISYLRNLPPKAHSQEFVQKFLAKLRRVHDNLTVLAQRPRL